MAEPVRFNSSFVKSASYVGGVLLVTLANGGTYRYHNVPEDVWTEFQAAPSAGKYFGERIKRHYGGEKVEA